MSPRAILCAVLTVTVSSASLALADPASDAKIQATPFSVEPGLGGAFAKCPAGKRAVGGGVAQAGRHFVYVSASGPLGASGAGGPLDPSGKVADTNDGDVATQWYAGVSNASSRRRAVKALAVCSRVSDATIHATSFWVAGRRSGHAYARCPAGRRAVGGGLVQSGWPDNRVLASGPLDATGAVVNTKDGDVAKQWYALVHNLPAHRVHFKVFALCSADSHATIEATHFSVRGRGRGDGFANCPTGKRALGGGILEPGQPRFLRVLATAPLDATGVPANTVDGDVAKRWYTAAENRNTGRVGFKALAICEP